MKPGTKWLIAVVGLLLLNAIAAITLIVVASAEDRSTVVPSYRLEGR